MTNHRRIVALCAALTLILSVLSGCGSGKKHTATDYTLFDTVTVITGYDSDRRFDEACEIVLDILTAYHNASDIYHEYAGINNACTLNQSAGTEPLEIPDELFALLSFGKKVYDTTNGMCNIAMGAVLSQWHECREEALNGGEARLPDDEALWEAAEHCKIDDIILDESNGTAYLSDSSMSIDLGAVAKGYAAEQAAEALEKAGYSGYAVSVGGNIRTVGKKLSESWIAGIQNPDTESEQSYVLRVRTDNAALVTSGVYQRNYTVDGVVYHHIISPETLYPKNDFLSVTILSADSGLADALSTAVFNMSYGDGLNYVNCMDDAEACWILADGTICYSDGFAEYIVEED